jgi:NADPH:quinone reductase-like Zn-dependent oxidoreductase
MHAAVLHTIGTVPRYEEFPEPVIGDKNREAIVHVHAASLKPVDKQLASGSHYASRTELPCVCGSDGVGHLRTGNGSSSVGLDRPTVRWHSVRSYCAHSPFQSPKI